MTYNDSIQAYEEQQEIIENLIILLKRALPHVQQMANECSTGPFMEPVDHLVYNMEVAILKGLP